MFDNDKRFRQTWIVRQYYWSRIRQLFLLHRPIFSIKFWDQLLMVASLCASNKANSFEDGEIEKKNVKSMHATFWLVGLVSGFTVDFLISLRRNGVPVSIKQLIMVHARMESTKSKWTNVKTQQNRSLISFSPSLSLPRFIYVPHCHYLFSFHEMNRNRNKRACATQLNMRRKLFYLFFF